MTTRHVSAENDYPFQGVLSDPDAAAVAGILDLYFIIQGSATGSGTTESSSSSSSAAPVVPLIQLSSYTVGGSETEFMFDAVSGSNIWEIAFSVPNTGASLGQVYNDDATSCHAVLIFNSDKIATSGGGSTSIPVEPGRAQWHVEQVDDLSFFNIDRCNGVENEDSSWPVFEEQSSSSDSSTAVIGCFSCDPPLDFTYALTLGGLTGPWEAYNGTHVLTWDASGNHSNPQRECLWSADILTGTLQLYPQGLHLMYPTPWEVKLIVPSADPLISFTLTWSTPISTYCDIVRDFEEGGTGYTTTPFCQETGNTPGPACSVQGVGATICSLRPFYSDIVVDWVDGYNLEIEASSGSLELVVAAGIGAGTSPDYGDTGENCTSSDTNVLDDAILVINGVPPVNGDIPLVTSPEIGIQRTRGLIELVIR